jgi:hypothetical protein
MGFCRAELGHYGDRDPYLIIRAVSSGQKFGAVLLELNKKYFP